MPRPGRKPTRRSTSLFFIALFLVLMTVVGLASYGITAGSIAVSGVQHVLGALNDAVSTAANAVVGYGHALVFARSIYAENEALRAQNQYLDSQLRLALNNRDELKRLQAQLSIQQQLPVKTILVQVTGRAANPSPLDSFIDHGTALGVVKDAGVFVADESGQTYAYGKVGDAFAANALVLPLLDSRCVLAGIDSRTGEDVLVKGTDGEFCELSGVSPLPQFQSGDVVVTSSASATFPPNIPIGRVDSVTSGGTTRLILRPFAAVSAARYLLVIKGSK